MSTTPSRWIVFAFMAPLAVATCQAQWAKPHGEVVFPDKSRVRVEIADTPELTQRGLMFRESMAENEGMVFIFERPGVYPFWMKNTLIPLDMLWIDANYRIVDIAASVPPCKADPCPTYPSTDPPEALYVVELVSGYAKKHNVKVGDRLEFKGIGKARP